MATTGKKATMLAVANAAGVSLSTVDRVINGRGSVSAKKVGHVLECARKLHFGRSIDYKPLRAMRIAVLMQDPTTNPFYVALHAGFRRANQLFHHLNVQCLIQYFEMLAPDRMAALIDSVVPGQDGLILVAYENPLVNEAVRRVATRIPVITMVSDLPHSGRRAYIGLDNRSAGRVAGELMARFLGPKGGEIMLLSGMHSFVGHEEREMGFRAVLRERFANCQVVKVLETREQIREAGILARVALAENKNIRGIYNVSTGNQSIAEAIEDADRADHIVFITHELTPARRALLREGVLDAVIDQNPELEVATTVETMLYHLGRLEERPPQNITPFYIHIRENA